MDNKDLFAFSNKKVVNRRNFLKGTGALVGGIMAMSLMSCGENGTTTKTGTDMPPTNSTGVTNPTTSITTTSTTADPVTVVPVTGTVGSGDNYDKFLIPGCTSHIAMDRLYSYDHVWVKKLEGNNVLMGITEKATLLIGGYDTSHLMTIPCAVGDHLQQDMIFCNVNGFKMNVEFLMPVSGKVLEINTAVLFNSNLVMGFAYTDGWILKLEMDHPEQLNDLLVPYNYGALQVPADYIWTGSSDEDGFKDYRLI